MELIDTSYEKVFERVSKPIEASTVQLDFKIVDETYIDEIVSFVNKNYNEKDGDTSLIYSRDLIKYYLIDSVPIFFTQKNKPDKIIALIIGKYIDLIGFDQNLGAIEGNFFCIIPQLRHINLGRLLKAYLMRECIKKYIGKFKLAYYTTNSILNSEPICQKDYIHRPINYDILQKFGIVRETNFSSMYKKLYSKFEYPEKFKQFKINTKIDSDKIEEITNKINAYQNNNYDIYEHVSTDIINNLNNSDAYVKFVIMNENNIEAFICFYILNIKKNDNIIKTLYLHYFYANGNIIDYLEYVGEYMKEQNICDMFLTHLFDEKIPKRYFQGSGRLYYNLVNIKHFTIKEQRLRLIMI
jgi:hypothetical protein